MQASQIAVSTSYSSHGRIVTCYEDIKLTLLSMSNGLDFQSILYLLKKPCSHCDHLVIKWVKKVIINGFTQLDRQRQETHRVPGITHRGKKGNAMFPKYFRCYMDMLKHRMSGNVSSILMKSTEVGQDRRILMACRYVICAVSNLKTAIDF